MIEPMPVLHSTTLACGHALELEECTECLACGHCRPIVTWQDPLCAPCYAVERAKFSSPFDLGLDGFDDWGGDDYDDSFLGDAPDPGLCVVTDRQRHGPHLFRLR